MTGNLWLADSSSRIFKYSPNKLYFMMFYDASYLHNVTVIRHHPHG